MVGGGIDAAAAAAAKLPGVAKVLVADVPAFEHVLAEPLAALLVALAPDYSHLLAAATAVGKNVMPRVAALLDVQPISDIAGMVDAETFIRPIYAGNALATVKSSDTKKVITSAPRASIRFPPRAGMRAIEPAPCVRIAGQSPVSSRPSCQKASGRS